MIATGGEDGAVEREENGVVLTAGSRLDPHSVGEHDSRRDGRGLSARITELSVVVEAECESRPVVRDEDAVVVAAVDKGDADASERVDQPGDVATFQRGSGQSKLSVTVPAASVNRAFCGQEQHVLAAVGHTHLRHCDSSRKLHRLQRRARLPSHLPSCKVSTRCVIFPTNESKCFAAMAE